MAYHIVAAPTRRTNIESQREKRLEVIADRFFENQYSCGDALKQLMLDLGVIDSLTPGWENGYEDVSRFGSLGVEQPDRDSDDYHLVALPRYHMTLPTWARERCGSWHND